MTMSSWCMQLDDEEDSKDGVQQHSASIQGWQSAGIPVAVTLILMLLGSMLLYTAATAVSQFCCFLQWLVFLSRTAAPGSSRLSSQTVM